MIHRLRFALVATLVALAASLTGTGVLTAAPAHAAASCLAAGSCYEIRNLMSGKCLDAENDPTVSGWTPYVNGDPIQLWTCTGTSNQLWHYDSSGYELINNMSGKCLDAENVPPGPFVPSANGDPVQLWNCKGTANQLWVGGGGLSAATCTYPGITYTEDSNTHVLDAGDPGTEGQTPFVNGDNVQLWTQLGAAHTNQSWYTDCPGTPVIAGS